MQGVILPFSLCASVMVMIGCDSNLNTSSAQDSAETETETETENLETQQPDQNTAISEKPLKSGNYLYIASDVAHMQAQAGQYLAQLQTSQEQLQQAITEQSPTELTDAANNLTTQLKAFNQTLNQLDLKTEEIDSIRQNIIAANTEVLSSPYLNEKINLSQIDFEKLESQMNSVQNEMFKLATVLIPSTKEDENS